MDHPKLNEAIKLFENYSFKGYYSSKKEVEVLLAKLSEVLQETELSLEDRRYQCAHTRLKLCLLQLQCTIERVLSVLKDSAYLKKTDILKLLTKKMHLCCKEVLISFENKPISSDITFQCTMSEVTSALKSSPLSNTIYSLIDKLLCSSLTIAKLSYCDDFKEISSSCKTVLTVVSSLKEEAESMMELNESYLSYQIKILERKVNVAMLRLFLHIMSYPQESLKALVKASGNSSKYERFSEDLDEEISEFDLTCDRIGLISNFAIMSCEQESLKLKVKNCLANLEFCEESLVLACIDFYLEPTHDKRELLKYLTNDWKSEVHLLNSLLDTIIDPATFSQVVFEDLLSLIHSVKNEQGSAEQFIQMFYRRCLKFINSASQSPDCSEDASLATLKKSLELELKVLENKITRHTAWSNSVSQLEVISQLVQQMSEHLNKILNNYSLVTDYVEEGEETKEWNNTFQDKCEPKIKFPLTCYLEKVHKNSPFVCTMYQKTPLKKKIKDNVAQSLDFSEFLCETLET